MGSLRGASPRVQYSFQRKYFALSNVGVVPKLLGLCKCNEGDSYVELRPLLEEIAIVEWPFHIYYIDNKCHINLKCEGLNKGLGKCVCCSYV